MISDRVFDLFAVVSDHSDHLCGVDEAGRGPLAGPVSAAAVILDIARPIAGLADSKALTSAERNRLALIIRRDAVAFAIAFASVEEIDRINILQATMLAMRRAVMALSMAPRQVLVDGNRCPDVPYPVRAIVKGDALVPSISAASILAKTARDEIMRLLAADYPEYGFEQHKGYGTKAHLDALQRHGPCAAHRRSFRPVREACERLDAR
ncbi:MAG: ribonuclease HII [Burkholderiales bacterium]